MEQEHEPDPELRVWADKDKAGLAIEAVKALQGAGEKQPGHRASLRTWRQEQN